MVISQEIMFTKHGAAFLLYTESHTLNEEQKYIFPCAKQLTRTRGVWRKLSR